METIHPNNRETRRLLIIKLQENVEKTIRKFEQTSESYQHPAIPINCYYLERTMAQIDHALKEVNDKITSLKHEGSGSSVPKPFITASVVKDLLAAPQFKAFNKCVEEQQKLNQDVQHVFSGISSRDPSDFKDLSHWWGGPIIDDLKAAYINALLKIEYGEGEESFKWFHDQVKEIKQKHISPFERRMRSLRAKYL